MDMKYGRLKQNIFLKGLRDIKNEGFLFFAIKTWRFFYHKYLKFRAEKIVDNLRKKPMEFFYFQGKKLEYLLHPYNISWANERSIEIPIVLNYIKNSKAKKIIEAGSVLKNYTKAEWLIVDKFEKGEGILNEDLVDFKLKEKYDFVVSISTLEHVGFDDENNPEKIIRVIENMKSWLNKNGKIIATMPLGYNKFMDNLIFNGNLGFSKIYFMKRINKNNKWIETSIDKIKGVKYGYPYNNANAIAIGVWRKI